MEGKKEQRGDQIQESVSGRKDSGVSGAGLLRIPGTLNTELGTTPEHC